MVGATGASGENGRDMSVEIVTRPASAALAFPRVLPAPGDEALPGLTALGPVPSERKARDWALVLQSMSLWHLIRRSQAGWIVLVNDVDYARASASIDGYEAENRDWPPRRTRERARHAASIVIPMVFAALVAFFVVTGPEQQRSFWFTHGVAISSQVLGRAPWTAVTALTLHADATHVLGNAISGTIFASAVQRRVGSGAAALAVLGSGIIGNVGNAVYHRAMGVDHGSLGASTAVFGAIGILAATELALHGTHAARRRSWVELAAPIVGGFALLGALGSGGGDGRTDVGAHLFGFLGGVLIGLSFALPMRRATLAVDMTSGAPSGAGAHEVALGSGAPRWWVQATLGAFAAALVIGSWEMALRI
jgi:membrane associated rhomboid family serine protease